MSKCPKVRPHDPHHLAAARQFLDEHQLFYGGATALRRKVENQLAGLLGQAEEGGWNMAMYRLRGALTSLTLVLSPTLWDWSLQKFATQARAELRAKAKAKKGS
jgi:hypothetical protein